MMETFGQRLQRLRKEKGLTQEDIANVISITPQSVSKWENDLSTPDIATLPTLANFLGVTCDTLLGNEVEAIVSTVKDSQKLLLKIVVDSADGDKVKINLPLSIIKVLINDGNLKLGDGDIVSKLDFDLIFSLIDKGVIGKLVEVNSSNGDRVSVFVE